MAKGTVRTTLTLPADLLVETDRVVREGGAQSRNELVARALARELAARRRDQIDRAFEPMIRDAEYQREAEQIADELAVADTETLRDIPK